MSADVVEKRRRYGTMVVGVSKAREPLHAALTTLAETLGCSRGNLVWLAIEALLKTPPTVAPAGAPTSKGSAAGFWVVPKLDKEGKAEGIGVVEVETRSQAGGRAFYRFKAGDTKARSRARKQAITAAGYDLRMLGLPADSITVDEFEQDDAS